MKKIIAIILIYLAISAPVLAHKPSDSFISIESVGKSWQFRWNIGLRDLEFAIGLDRDQNGLLTRGEVTSQSNIISAYALSRIKINSTGEACQTPLDDFEIKKLEDGNYASLTFSAQCPNTENVELNYSLFFDFDPTHRGLISVRNNDQTFSYVVSDSSPVLALSRIDQSGLNTLSSFLREGIWHIWIGFDHVLFLLTLILPAVLFRRNHAWQSTDNIKIAMIETLKIVTVFTIAHSITLSLASLQILTFPSRFVESMIAFSVLVTAINNLRPFFRHSRWIVAFGFGLIHGFGFANVLLDLGLSGQQTALSLLGFNLGVEIGQLVIVIIFLPLIYLIRDSLFYRWGLLRVGSSVAAVIASIWLVERLFDYQLLTI